MMSDAPLLRVIVVGTSGSGKTTLARRIAQALGVLHIELDNLYWEPGWQEAPAELFAQRIAEAAQAPRWVMDGNYSKVRALTWTLADTLVWLDYPRHVVMGRVLRRTVDRVVFRRRLWRAGNVETLGKVLSRDSILWWAWSTYSRRRQEYPRLFAQPEYAHLKVIRFRSPRQTEHWLKSLDPVPAL